ncbi:MAG: hypothetical protein FWG47_06150 [Propionibacteriaceae bacterium]|nr:hypothetical protein [Propionibacteriaceae bacterium]
MDTVDASTEPVLRSIKVMDAATKVQHDKFGIVLFFIQIKYHLLIKRFLSAGGFLIS